MSLSWEMIGTGSLGCWGAPSTTTVAQNSTDSTNTTLLHREIDIFTVCVLRKCGFGTDYFTKGDALLYEIIL